MSFTIPAGITDWAEKVAYCLAATEKLRLDHNEHGTRFRNGEIDQAAWDQYRNEVFDPLSYEIARALIAMRDYPPQEAVAATSKDVITETGVVFPEGSSWVQQVGIVYALLGRSDLTEQERMAVQSALYPVPQEALDAVSLFTRSLTKQGAFLILKDGRKVPLDMTIETISWSDGRVDRKIVVPTINNGVATN